MNLSGPYASADFERAIDEVRRTPIEDPAYGARLQQAVRLGVAQSPSNFLYSTPWLVVTRATRKRSQYPADANSVGRGFVSNERFRRYAFKFGQSR